MNIDLATAQSIITQALATGQEHGFKPLTVVVLDAGGHVIAVSRQDGASNNRFEIAQGKAYGALALGMGSRAIMERRAAGLLHRRCDRRSRRPLDPSARWRPRAR